MYAFTDRGVMNWSWLTRLAAWARSMREGTAVALAALPCARASITTAVIRSIGAVSVPEVFFSAVISLGPEGRSATASVRLRIPLSDASVIFRGKLIENKRGMSANENLKWPPEAPEGKDSK